MTFYEYNIYKFIIKLHINIYIITISLYQAIYISITIYLHSNETEQFLRKILICHR